MLNHPTYEQWTEVFSPWSTYEGSREQGSDINFVGPSGEWMIAKIAENRLYAYISIAHKWERMKNKETGILETTMYDHEGFENYSFISLWENQTQIDVELTAIPDEYSDMFNWMWPKSLEVLKDLCEQ
jgi:hypothetical protein